MHASAVKRGTTRKSFPLLSPSSLGYLCFSVLIAGRTAERECMKPAKEEKVVSVWGCCEEGVWGGRATLPKRKPSLKASERAAKVCVCMCMCVQPSFWQREAKREKRKDVRNFHSGPLFRPFSACVKYTVDIYIYTRRLSSTPSHIFDVVVVPVCCAVSPNSHFGG